MAYKDDGVVLVTASAGKTVAPDCLCIHMSWHPMFCSKLRPTCLESIWSTALNVRPWTGSTVGRAHPETPLRACQHVQESPLGKGRARSG
eukprot:2133611-Rhodomonas_salina.5